jgi:signal transduction histidine kinase
MIFPVFHLPILVIISFILLVLGVLVYFKKRRSATNKSFLLLTFSILLWIVTLYISDHPSFASQAVFWNRATMAAGFLIGLFLLYLVLVFPEEKISISLFWKIVFIISGIISVLCLCTNLIVKDVEFYSWGTNIVGGKLFFLSVIWSIFNMGAEMWVGFSKFKKSIGIERTQFKFLLMGILLFFIAGLIFNMIFPAVTGTNEYAKYGSYFTLFYIIPIAIGITRYHLFGIEVILTEILVGVIGILLLVQIFVAQSTLWKIVNGGIFVLFCIFGYLLIRGVFREIRRREEVERISRAKTEFISITSHQLRTPLTVIKGYLSMILEGVYGEVSEKVKKVLENIYLANERLIKLVNSFLNVSKIELGKLELELERADIVEIVESVVKEMEIAAKEKNLYLKFEKPKEVPKILIDKEKIREIILNLVDNAIKYTQEGGVEVKLQILNNRLQIVVADTGEGLTKEEREKLFESFSRGSAGQKYWVEGAGIGLYVAKKIVELHQGKIWVESEGKGKGSKFYVELPIK